MSKPGITDFLKTTTDKEKLKTTLEVLLEFKSHESQTEWLSIPFSAWAKFEQLQEFLNHLVDGKELDKDTVEYIKHLRSHD